MVKGEGVGIFTFKIKVLKNYSRVLGFIHGTKGSINENVCENVQQLVDFVAYILF